MTRAEQELHVRQIKRSCRGDMLFADEVVRNKFRSRLGYLQTVPPGARDNTLVLLIKEMEATSGKACPGEQGTWLEAFDAAFQFLFSYRENCGADFNNIICAGPFDGREHEYTCPCCGQKGIYIAPAFEQSPSEAVVAVG